MDAQVQTGINGTVVDAKGAVIAGANVTVTNNSTNVVTQGTATSSAGTFTVIGLIPGTYTVTVDAPGFKRSVKTGVLVEISKESAVAFKMAPGTVSQTVQVTSNEISLNTTSPEMSTTLEPELVQTLPIEVSGGPRAIDAFVGQAPGVTATGSMGEGYGYILSGGQSSMDSFYINGVPIVYGGVSSDAYGATPPYEMIKEFSVNVSTYAAQYGLSQGTVTYNTASGTDQLHGDGFDILRNQLFDSDGFFPVNFNAAGKPMPPVNHQNDYGFTLGGPIIIPKLYDGRGRTFFHFSLDNYYQNEYIGGFGTVPTAAMKSGDFSNFVDANDNQIPIYDPLTGQQFEYNGKLNVIPPSRISPISQSVLQYIPTPDRTGTNFGLQNNKSAAIPAISNSIDLFGFTLDHSFSKKQSIHYAEWRHNANNPGFNEFPIVPLSNPLQAGNKNIILGDGFLLNYVNSLTPNLVTTAGASWYGYKEGSEDAATDNTFAGVVDPAYFPSITFDGQSPVTTFGPGGQGGGFDLRRAQGFAVDNNWLWSKGRNTFNIGGEYRYNMRDEFLCEGCTGVFNFSQRTTSTPNSSDPNFGSYGSSFASFLLGEVDSGFRINNLEMKIRSTGVSPYIEDNIKVNHRLTVDAGLRWDILVPFHDIHNNVVFADLTAPDPGTGGLLGAVSKYGNCLGCAGVDRANIHWRNFGPRFGFSYMVNSKTVIQSGYYLAYLNGGAYNLGNSRITGTYSSLLAGSFSRNSTGTNQPGYGDWDTFPMPNPPPLPFSPSMANGGFPTMLDTKKAGIAPYTQQWVLSLQRQLPWDQFLTVAYIGNRIIHLPSALNDPNQLDPKYLSLGPLLGESVTSPDAVTAGIKIPYPNFINDLGSNATVQQALLPFPQWSGLDNNFDDAATTLYNGLEVQEEKRFTNGFSYLASLTLARNMANQDYGIEITNNFPVNTYDQALEWAPSTLDTPYMVKIDTTYELPIGRGQRYWNSRGLLANLFGDWQVAAILNYSGGYPLGSSENNSVLNLMNADGDGINRPDFVPGVSRKTFSYGRSIDYFSGKSKVQPVQFTTNAFTPSPYYGLGNVKRNYVAIHSAPYRMEDFDAMKYFHVTDRVVLTLRCDYFNAFNRTQLPYPDNNISDSTFGMVTNQSSQISNRQGQATFRIDF
ncbi:MAG: outer membrane beta-barrel protein [Acidimicrobiales bacterium]